MPGGAATWVEAVGMEAGKTVLPGSDHQVIKVVVVVVMMEKTMTMTKTKKHDYPPFEPEGLSGFYCNIKGSKFLLMNWCGHLAIQESGMHGTEDADICLIDTGLHF